MAMFMLGSEFADEATAEAAKRSGANCEKSGNSRDPTVLIGQTGMTNPVWREGKCSAYLHVVVPSLFGLR